MHQDGRLGDGCYRLGIGQERNHGIGTVRDEFQGYVFAVGSRGRESLLDFGPGDANSHLEQQLGLKE